MTQPTAPKHRRKPNIRETKRKETRNYTGGRKSCSWSGMDGETYSLTGLDIVTYEDHGREVLLVANSIGVKAVGRYLNIKPNVVKEGRLREKSWRKGLAEKTQLPDHTFGTVFLLMSVDWTSSSTPSAAN